MNIGERIFDYRKKAGLSQEELANQLNITRQSVSLWENNQVQPSLDNLFSLAQIFKIPLDELCGKETELKADTEEEPLVKGHIKYDKSVYKKLYRITYKKNILWSSIVFVLAVIILLNIIFYSSNKAFIFFPIFLMVLDVVFFLRLTILVARAITKELQLKPNHYTETSFYKDRMVIISHSTNSSVSYTKGYLAIQKVKEDDQYFYLFFEDIIDIITKDLTLKNLNQIKSLIYQHLVIPNSKNKQSKLLFSLFLLSIISIFISLGVVAFITHQSPIPEFPLAMVENMWIFFVFALIPFSSLVIGIIYKLKGYKCLKNIVIGVIFTFLMLSFGSFTYIFGKDISHDYKVVNDLGKEINLSLPPSGNVSIAYNYNIDCNFLLMARFTENYRVTLINNLASNGNWSTSINPFIGYIDLYSQAFTSDYDYFAIYSLTEDRYDIEIGSYLYMAYDVDSNLFYVYCYKG